MDRLSIAASGLSVATAQLDASAHNVANLMTTGFQPAAVAAQEAPQGGAQAVSEPPADDRGADVDRALLAPSRTDLVAETANGAAVTALYRANLQSLASVQETDAALFDMVR